MLFTMGNLITLGIVLVVLLIYRQLDRDNRSLEKVKKFAERLQGDLDVYVDKKAEDLKRFGIELDVQQKAAKVALDRIQNVQEGLAARAEAIGGIEKRLGEYDAALARLMDMTARVDENLARLHDEASFTDSVARKLDSAERTMAAIDRDLPAMRESFAKDAASAMESFKDEMLADVGRRLGEVTAILERAKSEAIGNVQRAESGRTELERDLARAFEKARIEAGKLEDIAFAKLKESGDAKAARLKELIEEKFALLAQLAKDKTIETQALVKTFKADWKADAEAFLSATKSEIDSATESLESRLDKAESRVESAERLYEERYVKVERRAEELAKELAEKAKAGLASQREILERLRTEGEAVVKASALELAKAEAASTEAAARASKEAAAIAARFQEERDALEAHLTAEGTVLTARAFEELGRRFAEYGSEAETRFEKLETAGAELGTLDSALRTSMEQTARRVENDFAAFGRSLEDRRLKFEEGFSSEAARLRDGMKALEEELDALKARAYDNVSEKLKIFEDEFFADLKARSDNVESRLEAWRADLERALAELSARTAEERIAAEKVALEDNRARLAENQARIQEQLEKMRERVEAVQDGIQAQSGMASEALSALRESVLKDASDARATAQSYVEGELSRFSLEAASRIKASERELNSLLEALGRTVGDEEERVRAARETVSRDSAAFQARFAETLAEAEQRVRFELEAFTASTTALVEKARGDYESQRDSFSTAAQAERDRISKELSGLADRTAELRMDLSSRITQALEGFARGYEALLADLEKRRREAQGEADGRLREYKDAVQDLALKLESGRAQSFGKVEAEAQRLSQILADIDKEQKSFIAQAKVFERTDELKERLSASIETMKADLARLDGRKAEVAELENQLGRVKRLEDEVNQKVTRFLAEKRRIDALEEDFTRLAAVSQGVDKKLEQVTGQADALTEAQASIRKVLDLSKDAETKYERLEKKAAVLDSTVEAVDKNFQSIQGIEKVVNAIGAELRKFPDRVSELKRGLDELSAGRDKTDEAVRKLGELDGVLADTEKRVVEVQKAREWLARAETRLEEIDRRAQEQLKLLSNLLKDEGGSKGGRSAPPTDVQTTVRKLARQGWNVDEIARAVKVSRGEVELILELGGKG